MRDLIARLESATGPDRKLDAAIRETVGLVWREDFYVWSQTGSRYRGQVNFTASLDAALMLVPAGHVVDLGRYADGSADCAVYASEREPYDIAGAETPALALCIAALRARLTMETPNADPR